MSSSPPSPPSLKKSLTSLFTSVLDFTIGISMQNTLMLTWLGLSPVALYLTITLPHSPLRLSYVKYNMCRNGVVGWYGITRFLWMGTNWRVGRLLRPHFPRRMQEYMLLTLTTGAMRWHGRNPLTGLPSPVFAGNGCDDGVGNDVTMPKSLPNNQVVFLNEPHGVGNAIFSTLHTAHILRKNNLEEGRENPTEYLTPVVVGSSSVCFVPFLPELIWLVCGRTGFEFAESTSDITSALTSNRDITIVPSGFSTIGSGGIVDWSKRGKLFKFIIQSAKREMKVISLCPVLWFQEIVLFDWYPKPNMKGDVLSQRDVDFEKMRVKMRIPISFRFPIGYALPVFFLPKRGCALIGIGERIDFKWEATKSYRNDKGKVVRSNEGDGYDVLVVNELKSKIKTEYDGTFERCCTEWNGGVRGEYREVESGEWEFTAVA